MKLVLPAALQARIAGEAHAAFPRECCGLLEGVQDGDALRAMALHPGRNLASAPGRFALDAMDHIAAQKAARANGHRLIGCYHSHPDGDARPSRHDQAGATQTDFLWVIAATDGSQCRLAGFVYRDSGFEDIVLGADLVTSSL